MIPNLAHFIFYGKPFGQFKPVEFCFLHYIAILSMKFNGGIDNVWIWTDCPPVGNIWWDRAVKHATVKLRDFSDIAKTDNRYITSVADRLRLELLYEYGGYYCDIDNIVLDTLPRDDLAVSTTYFGPEAVYGTSVVGATTGHPVVQQWRAEYLGDTEEWAELGRALTRVVQRVGVRPTLLEAEEEPLSWKPGGFERVVTSKTLPEGHFLPLSQMKNRVQVQAFVPRLPQYGGAIDSVIARLLLRANDLYPLLTVGGFVGADCFERVENTHRWVEQYAQLGAQTFLVEFGGTSFSSLRVTGYASLRMPFTVRQGRNLLIELCTTPVLNIVDIDVIQPHASTAQALTLILQNEYDFVMPFNTVKCIHEGKARALQQLADPQFPTMHTGSPGYSHMFDPVAVRRLGGYTRRYVGTGPEDTEMVGRAHRSGLRICRLQTAIAHLEHPRATAYENNPYRALGLSIYQREIKAPELDRRSPFIEGPRPLPCSDSGRDPTHSERSTSDRVPSTPSDTVRPSTPA